MNKKLYYHKTDGGAEYLCASPIEGTDEGDLFTTIIRLDGQPELLNFAFAAAPEMLEALQELYRILIEDEGYMPYNPKMAQAKAIIKAATG